MPRLRKKTPKPLKKGRVFQAGDRGEVVGLIINSYSQLRDLDPDNDLLRYISLDPVKLKPEYHHPPKPYFRYVHTQFRDFVNRFGIRGEKWPNPIFPPVSLLMRYFNSLQNETESLYDSLKEDDPKLDKELPVRKEGDTTALERNVKGIASEPGTLEDSFK